MSDVNVDVAKASIKFDLDVCYYHNNIMLQNNVRWSLLGFFNIF